MADKGFQIKCKKKGQMSTTATYSFAAKDSAEAKKKFQKEHPDLQIIEIKQTWG